MDVLTFIHPSSKKSVTLSHSEHHLTITQVGSKPREIPLRQVLQVSFSPDDRRIQLSYLKRKQQGSLAFLSAEGFVKDVDNEFSQRWADKIMSAAYHGVKRGRKLKVILNPHSGVRKAIAHYNSIVEPILLAGGCSIDIEHTTGNSHAYNIAKTLPLDFDAVITVSGDGLVHEVLNGFAHHEHPTRALDIPIAPIPTGSGNGLSLNILGIEDGFDIAAAALNAIKGFPMKVDVFSFVQDGTRNISFMSQAIGLMADLDIGTDHLRWMGESRFVYGFLRGLMHFKSCPVQLFVKEVERDKDKMAETLRERRLADEIDKSTSVSAFERYGPELPPLKYSMDDEDGWTTFDQHVLYVYAGKGPYVGRDLMAFPVSLPNDGLIDIMIQAIEGSSRADVLMSMPGAPKGKTYWKSSNHYIKAHAYRVKPLSKKGSLSVDGESFPFKEFQVEVHPELGTLLSPHGYYAADFGPRLKKT